MKYLAALLGAMLCLPALADSEHVAVRLTPQYQTECGSCHVAFPPGLLGKADWQKTMARLDRHFGTDASLDDTSRANLQSYLERNAGKRNAAGAVAEPRITTSAWFKREHDEVPAKAWKDTRVKNAANCAACHKGAEQGRYGEGEIAIPGGQRRQERS